MLQLLLPFQKFFVPALILLVIWSSYRTVFKGDRAVGLVLYIGLVIITDFFYDTGIFIPWLKKGSIKYSEICAIFLLLSNPAAIPSSRNNRLILILIFIYFLFFFYASFRGFTIENGIFNFRRFIFPQIVAFTVAFRGFAKKEDYRRFMFYFMTLLLIIGLFTFWDVFFDRWILKGAELTKYAYWFNREKGRFGSLFMNPNDMGGFAVLVLPAALIAALLEKNSLKRIYCWICVLALAFAFVETQSRGPVLAIAVSLLFFVFIPTKKYTTSKKIGLLIVFLFVFYLFMPGFFEHLTERFSEIEKETTVETRSRWTIWLYTVKIISNHPVFGIGLGEGQYFKYMMDYGFRDEYSKWPMDNPHNSYLQIAVQGGVPALMAFIMINFILIKKGIYTILGNMHRENSLYLMGFIAGMVGFLASLIPEMYMFTQALVPVYWVFFGLIFSMTISEGELRKYESTHIDRL